MGSFFEVLFLVELKNRVILVFCCWVFSFFVLYTNKNNLFFDISRSAALYDSYSIEVSYFIFTSPSEVMSVHLHLVSFFSGCFAFFSALHNTISFLAPSLQVSELKKLRPFSGLTVKLLSLFVASIFKIFVVILVSRVLLVFSVGYNSESPNPLLYEASISQYVDFYLLIFTVFLGVFTTFVFLSFFVSYSKVYNNTAKKYRSFYYGVACFSSTITVACDLFSQLAYFTAFLLLFEHSVFIWSVRKASVCQQNH